MNNKTFNNLFQKKNIPNAITLFRILLIFPIIILLEINQQSYVWVLIIIGGISDYADGFIAKKYNAKTSFGAIIDPLADKLLILVPFSWLCINKIIPYWSFSIIIVREFLITSFRKNKSNGMPAISIAKYKSFFQFLTLLLLLNPFNNFLFFEIGLITYWISFILSIYSSLLYLSI